MASRRSLAELRQDVLPPRRVRRGTRLPRSRAIDGPSRRTQKERFFLCLSPPDFRAQPSAFFKWVVRSLFGKERGNIGGVLGQCLRKGQVVRANRVFRLIHVAFGRIVLPLCAIAEPTVVDAVQVCRCP